jgi:hypothetical protein
MAFARKRKFYPATLTLSLRCCRSTTPDEKQALMPAAFEYGCTLFFEHDPEAALARIESPSNGFRAIEKSGD